MTKKVLLLVFGVWYTRSVCVMGDRVQVLGLEAALEAQRIDTEDKVAQASKAAQVAAEKSYAQRVPAMQAGPGAPGGHTSPVQIREGMNKIAATIQMFNASTGRAAPSNPQTPGGASAGTLGVLSGSPSSSLTPTSGTPAGSAGNSAYESELDRRQQEMQAKQQQLAMQQRSENQDALVKAIERPLGFHRQRPIAAMVIFRSCIQWHAFEADRTNLFERIITTIGEQIEQGGGGDLDNNDNLCYWLSNTVTLLLLLQKNIKPAATASSRRTVSAAPAQGGFLAGARSTFSSFLGGTTRRASMGNTGDASIHGGGHGGFKQIAAKYPALLFKQQLDACMGKIFPLLRDNVKRAVQTPLSVCSHPACVPSRWVAT